MQSGDVSPVPWWWSSWGKHCPWRGTAGQTAQAGEPCPFETIQRGEASQPRQRGPGLFPPAMKEKKEWMGRHRKVRTTTDLGSCASFTRQQRAYDIPAFLTVGWSVSVATSVSCALFSSHWYTDYFSRYRVFYFIFFFFLPLGCYSEHCNLIRHFDKHLTLSGGLLSLVSTAQGKRLRLTNFHPQFSVF